MSYHTTQYLNRKMKKGNTDKTGYAWWYDANLEDPSNPSHYPGFIPLPVVHDFFGWDAAESVSLIAKFNIPKRDENGTVILGDDGNAEVTEYQVPVKDFKALGRSDWIVDGIPAGEESTASKILSIVGNDYGVHQAKQIFIDNVIELVGGADNIGVESIGELKNGRRLFGSISVPENLSTDSGLAIRPILTICTSYDQTLATKYVRTFGVPVCDNTLNWELTKAGEKDGNFTIRHTKNSAARLSDAKVVLGLLQQGAEQMNEWMNELHAVEVPETQFARWLNLMVPIPDVKKTKQIVKSTQGEDVEIEKISTNAQSIALKRQDDLMQMYDNDPRVSPWKGTRLGILQLWNTYQQHEVSFKGAKQHGGNKNAARAEINMNKMIEGKFTDEDMSALRTIVKVAADESEAKTAIAVMDKPVKAPAKKAAPRKSTPRKQTPSSN